MATPGKIAKFDNTGKLTNSIITDTEGGSIGIGTASPDRRLTVPQDYSKARKWYEEAAAAGNTDAMINLGRLYEQGLGVAQDYGKALEWFRKALEAGNSDAMINLTRLYEQGQGANILNRTELTF
jgi:TPR repeat protein